MSELRIIDGIEYERFGDSYVPVGEAPGGDAATGPFVSLAGLKARPVRWGWHGRVPLGVATLVAGVPGVSKTSVVLHIGARITRGELPGDLVGEPASIVVMSLEDMLHETIIPRLQAEGADMTRVFALPFTGERFSLRDDLAKLEELVVREKVRLVILDPLLAFTEGDTFKESEVRKMLAPL
jgi:RecA-family ATPase